MGHRNRKGGLFQRETMEMENEINFRRALNMKCANMS